jgi:hypothetical protein
MLHRKLLYLLIVIGELSVVVIATFRIVVFFFFFEQLTPWCLIFGMPIMPCDDQNIIHLVFACYTIQLMHYSHFKTQSLQHLKPIKC